MKLLNIGGALPASPIALGCMRMSALPVADAAALIETALDAGVTFFDHADIYGGDGAAEAAFAAAAKHAQIPRRKMTVQTKCGIRKGYFDFSKEHILASVDGSLKRLNTDYLDALLLHRPDTLMEPEEVDEAFALLHKKGKVRHFGVSNQNPGQIRLLRQYVKQPLIINQLQFSPAFTGMIDRGFNVNMQNPPSADRDGGVLEYCRLKKITVQAWSPFQYGFFGGSFIGSDKYPELNAELERLAAEYGATPEAVSVAWILRHPARMQVIAGTTKPERVRAIAQAYGIALTREQWYAVYKAAGNKLP